MKLKLGSKLYSIRQDKKMTQEAMAELLSMSQTSYQRLEKGDTSVPYDELPRIANALGVGVQELIPDTLSVYSNNNTNQSGLIFGNGNVTINNFTDKDQYRQSLEKRIQELEALLERKKDD